MDRAHVIESLEFDVAFATETAALDRLPQLTDFLKSRALAVIQKVFDQTGDPGSILRLARVEVDLGTIAQTDLESSLASRLLERLREALRGMSAVPSNSGAASARMYSRERSELEALAQFLANGRLPWHVTDSLEQLAERVLGTSGPLLAHLLRDSAQRDNMMRRMLRQLGPAWVAEFVNTLAPAHAGDLIGFARALEAVCPFFSGSGAVTTSFRRLIWETLLGGLLANNGTEPLDVCALMLAMLGAAVASANNRYSSNLTMLCEALVRFSRAPPTVPDLADLIAGLQKQPAPLAPAEVEDSVAAALSCAKLEAAFASGVATGIASEWRALLKEQPESVRSVLLRLGRTARVRRRIAQGFPDAMIADLVGLLVPTESGFIRAIVERAVPFRRAVDAPTDDAADGTSALRPRLWEFTLTYLLVDRGSHFNKRSYLGSLVRQMAMTEGVSYSELLQTMREELQGRTVSDAVHAQMLQFLSELAEIEMGSERAREFDRGAAPGQKRRGELICEQLEAAVSRCDAQQISARAPRSLTILAWEFTLAFVTADRGSQFNRRSYMSSLVRQMAMRDAADYVATLHAMREIMHGIAHPDGLFVQMSEVLDEIIEDEGIASTAGPHESNANAQNAGSEEAEAKSQSTGSREAVVKPEDTGSREADVKPRAGLRGVDVKSESIGSREVDVEPRGTGSRESDMKPWCAGARDAENDSVTAGRGPAGHALVDTASDEASLSLVEISRLLDRVPRRRFDGLLRILFAADHDRIRRCCEVVLQACRDQTRSASWHQLERLSWEFILQYRTEGKPFAAGEFAARLAHFMAARLRPGNAVRGEPFHDRAAAADAIHGAHSNEGGSTDQGIDGGQGAEAIYVANAGLVLAVPYIPRLFEMLGLVSDSSFTNPSAAERAVHLLQFMVSGCERCSESQLVFNKILCGLLIDTPIEREVDLTVRERIAVEGLLQAMIRNWAVIGSTSVQGLRESFLQREGKLTHKAHDWHLQVASKPFDMLLNRLPWGFSTVKYAWMRAVVHVNWR
jgi:hypothetical protein